MGARTHSARRYRRDCEVIIMFEYIYAVRSGDRCFSGEVEIYDFVTERAKRCIAAKKENVWRRF